MVPENTGRGTGDVDGEEKAANKRCVIMEVSDGQLELNPTGTSRRLCRTHIEFSLLKGEDAGIAVPISHSLRAAPVMKFPKTSCLCMSLE